jgi:multiple sugar transport system permease protein
LTAAHLTPDAAPHRPALELRDRGFWYPYLLIAPTMITLVIVSLIPFLYAAFLSLHEIKYGQVRGFAWLDNYAVLLADGRFWNSMWVAFVFVAVAVPIEFMLGLIGALVLQQGVRFQRIIVPFLFIPTMMAPIVVGLLWKIMLAGSWGLLSYNIIERFGILTETSVFASPSLALFALIMVDVWQWTPFMVLAFFAGLQALPLNPYRAAAVDGANAVQVLFRVTLPMMTPLLAVIGLLRLIYAYKVVFDYWEIGKASALAVVVWLVFFVFCSLFYQIAKKRLKAF